MTWLKATLVLASVIVLGCNPSPPTGGTKAGADKSGGAKFSAKDELAGLGVAYHGHHSANNQGPDTADDLINLISAPDKRESFAKSEACQRLKAGDYVINPRLQFRKVKDLGKVAILYEKKVPAEGGIVVLGDGTAVEMKAADFAKLDTGDDARAPAKKRD